MKTNILFNARTFVYATALVVSSLFLLGSTASSAPAYCIVMDSGTSALTNTSRAATDGVTATIITGTVTSGGTWARSSSNAANYNGYTLTDNDATDNTKWIAFAPTLPEAGKYVVQIWWLNSASQATNVPVDICHDGVTETTHVDQSAQGSRWVTLGICEFAATNDGAEFVRIRNNGGTDGATEGKYIRADVIRFLSFEALTELDNIAEIKTTPETDPANHTGVYMIGSWSTSTNSSGYYGANYSNDGTKAVTKAVLYTPVLPGAGHYDVQMWYPAAGGFCAAVPVDIYHSGAIDTVTVNQTANGGKWNSLGVYEFTGAGAEYIKIRTDNGAGGTLTGTVIADAVRFVKIETGLLTLIDNTAPDDTDAASKVPGDGVTTTGAWTAKTTTAGYYGINYWTDNGTGKGSKSVTYTPRLPASGTYTVQAWWPNTNVSFATNTPVDIIHSGITHTVIVDQTQNGGQWNTLGVYVFTGDGDEYVKIKNDGTEADKHVIADAIRFVESEEPPPNTAPTITTIANQVIAENTAIGALAFTVGDAETAPATLVVSAASSNLTLLPEIGIVLGGSGANRTVTLTPASGQTGNATVTLTVSDGDLTAQSAFTLTVQSGPPPNTAPTITTIANQVIAENTATGALAFTVGDAETSPAALVVSAASSNQALLPDTGIVLGGSGANRTVTLTPASGQTGNATVTLTVSDGDLTAQSAFTLTVQMPEPLTLIDNTAPGDTDPASKIPGDGVTTQGSWSGKNTTAGYYGNNYWTDNAAGKGSKSVTYTPRLTASGTYTVQAWWPNTNASFATNTPIDIIHSGITDTVTVNQQQNGGQWNTLGVYVFTGAGDEYVKIRNDGTDADKHVIADAVQFIPYTAPPPPPEPRLFMDNTAADDTDTASKVPGPGVTTQGNWAGSVSRAGFQGHSYWTDGNTGGSGASTISKSVTYTPIFPAAGRYMVQMWWPRYATNFATNTPVDIKHNGVTETFSVNQRTGGEMWYSLGIFDFAGTGDEYLKIRNEGADYYVIADAVRFVSVDEQEPFVMSFDKIATNQSSSCRRAFGAGLYDEVSNQTYICWNGPGMSVYIRAYDHATETWGAAQEICHLTYTNQYDYHDYPVLTLAPDGKLLVYFCQHASKLYQLKAPDPHSIAGAWTKTEISDDLNAYPMPVVAGADIFLFYSKNNDSSWPHRQYRYIKSSDSGATWMAPSTIIDTDKTDPQKFDEVYGWGFYYNEATKRIGLTWTMAGGASHNAAHKGLYFAWFDTTNNNITTVAGASLGSSVVHSELAGCLVNGATGDHTDPVKGHHYPFTSPQPAFDHISGQPVIAYGYYDPNTGRQSIRCSRWTGAAWVDSIIQQNVKSFADIRQNGIGELVALYHYSGNILMKSSQDGGVTWEQVSAGAVPFSDGCDKVAELHFLDNIKAPLTAFLGLGFDDTTKPGGYNYDGVFPVYIIKEDIADSLPVFLVHPDAGAGVTGGSQLVLNVAASGKPTPVYQWQVKEGASASWRNLTAADTNYTGIDTDSLTILAAGIGMDGWEFRAVADNGGSPVYGNATTIVILLLPAFDISPVAEQAAVAGRTLDIAASVSSPTPMTLQWQVNDGSGWRNLTADDTNYSGFNTDTLSILSVTEAMDNWRYRLVAGNALGDNNTNGTTLKVMPAGLAAPAALVFDADGNSYVADTGNNRIYQIDPSKKINTLAGAATAGLVDDIGTGARFSAPQGIAIHPTLDALLVADTANAVIRSVTATGTTATFLGPVAGMAAPVGIAFDTAGDMYISDAQKHVIHVLRSGTPGVYAGASGTAGFADDSATGAAARFNTPAGIAFGIDGNLYIADAGNDAVRVILPVDTNDFSVATLAGVVAGISAPRGLAVSGSGPDMRVYLANTGGNNICEIDENGTVTILAGHATGVAGFKDGTGTNAWFDHPEGVTIGADGNLYVADTGNAVIRKITFDSNDQAVVTTQLLATGSSIEPPPIPPDPGNIYDSGRRSGGGAPTVWFSLLAALLIACRSTCARKKPWACSEHFNNQ